MVVDMFAMSAVIVVISNYLSPHSFSLANTDLVRAARLNIVSLHSKNVRVSLLMTEISPHLDVNAYHDLGSQYESVNSMNIQ